MSTKLSQDGAVSSIESEALPERPLREEALESLAEHDFVIELLRPAARDRVTRFFVISPEHMWLATFTEGGWEWRGRSGFGRVQRLWLRECRDRFEPVVGWSA